MSGPLKRLPSCLWWYMTSNATASVSLHHLHSSLQRRSSTVVGAVLALQTRSAGHSHWQNVRHVKAAKDREKQILVTNIISKMNGAIKEADGQRDPKQNSKLQQVIDQARKSGVNLSVIEKVLSAKDTVDPYTIGFTAPGGIFILVESCSAHTKTEANKIQSVVKKYGNIKFREGISTNFKHEGQIMVNQEENQHVDSLKSLDDATMLAIDIGAEDVELVKLDANDKFGTLQFTCSVFDLKKVRQALEGLGVKIAVCEERYSPKDLVQITQESYNMLNEMYEKIQKTGDMIQRIYDNVEVVSGADVASNKS